MKKFLYIKKSRWLLLILFTLFVSTGQTWAQKALPYSYGFEDYNLDTDGWTKYFGTSLSSNNNGCGIYGEAKKTGSYGFRFSSYSTKGANAQYLISPELNAPNGVIVSFAYKVQNGGYPESFKVGYSTTDTDVSSFTWDEGTTSNSTSFTTYENTFPAGTKYVAIYYYSNYCCYLYVDDFSFTAPANGPALVVKDYDTKQTLTSPANYSFGFTTAGTIHYFLLNNPGTQDLGVTLSKTGNFGATLSTTTVPAGGASNVALTVTMPDASGSSEITIMPEAGSGIDPFVINVSGTIRDPNKVYLDFADGQIPDGWTSVAIGSYASSYGSEWSASTGYVSQSGSSSNYEWAFTSPMLTFENGETIFFETQKYSSSTWYTPSIKVEYSLDNSTWTTIGSAFTDDTYDTWTSRSITIPVDGVKYIRFSGWYIKLRNIYGGEEANEPNMKVTQPTALDYGVITEATQKTFTIANTGKATLEGINVTSSNAAFTISNAPTSLAAGASQEVTITMDATTTGALSSDITVSATGMTDVVFTVTGAVLPDGMLVVDFNDNQLPAGWTNASWTFANGEATGKSSSAYLTTPTLQFSDGDLLVIKAKRYDSDTYDYLTVQGSSDNGSTWTAYSRKLQNADGLTYPDYSTIVLSDIPSTVNKLRFVGYYAVVDEIAGLTYAPVLSVTLGSLDCTSPENLNFGECAADASATYNFANTGAGTINITNVAITGDGAAAYSTNWTESVAVPFDLTITRSYDATRTEAQAAVITVTTSEGDFIINVTGTDKAANAPELTVTPSEDADFGTQLKAAPAAKTYTITNSGTGTLTGNISSSTSDFTVSESEFSLGAAESMTFDITLNFDTNYGAKASVITVHPTIDGLEDVTINATASTLDPDAWTEDFSAGTLPTGWTQGTWTIGTFSNYENTTTMALAPSGSSAGTLITPCLSAKEGDILTWDAYFNWYDEAMTVEYSNNDQATWTKIYDAYKAEDEFGSTRYTHKAMSFTAPADGNYYLRFTSTYSNGVDNFAGFKLNLPDHIMAITASSIPTSGSYSPSMKATQSFNATVTVKESRGVDEENVVAKLYMGEEVIGTSEATTVEAGESKQITIICTPTIAATEGVQMHIEVEWAGTTLSTDAVTRYVAEFVKLELTETEEKEITTGYSAVYDQVTLTRSFVAGWNTFVAPLAVNVSEFGEGAKVYSFTGYDGGALSFSVVTSSSLDPATPYIVYVPEAINNKVFTWNSPVIYSSYVGEDNIKTSNNGVTFQGSYAPMEAGDLAGCYGISTAGKIAKASATATMKGFRAYFTGVDLSSARVMFFGDGGTTGIDNLTPSLSKEEGAQEVYDLQGRKVVTPKRGMYIVNGKKVVIK